MCTACAWHVHVHVHVHAFDSRLPSSTVSRSARAFRLVIPPPPPPPPKREPSSVGFFAGLDGRTQRVVGRCLGRCLTGAEAVPRAVPRAVPLRRSRATLPGPSSAAEPTGLPCASRRAPQAVGGQLCRWQVGAECDRAVPRVRCGVEGVDTVRGASGQAALRLRCVQHTGSR